MIKDGCWMDALRARQRLEVKDGGQGKKGREGEREKGKGKSGCLFRENPTPEKKKRTQDGKTGFGPEMLLIVIRST